MVTSGGRKGVQGGRKGVQSWTEWMLECGIVGYCTLPIYLVDNNNNSCINRGQHGRRSCSSPSSVEVAFLCSCSAYTQATDSPHIPLHITREPPSPEVRKQAGDDGSRTDAKRRLVAVVRPLGAEQLRAHDAADLAHTALEGQREGRARAAF